MLFKDITRERSELKVLDHLFLVIGNGYSWYDGYLTVDYGEGVRSKWDEKKDDVVITKGEKYGKQRFQSPVDENFFKSDKVEIMSLPKTKIEIPIVHKSLHDWEPYPLFEGARLLNIPKNVRPDWLAGASKILIETEKFYRNNPEHADIAHEHSQVLSNLQSARGLVDRKKGLDGRNDDEVIMSVIP
jgi:hypothetical protein